MKSLLVSERDQPNDIINQQILFIRIGFLRGMLYLPFRACRSPIITVKTNNPNFTITKEFKFTYDKDKELNKTFLTYTSQETGQAFAIIEEKFMLNESLH
jgi:hypothetical protein